MPVCVYVCVCKFNLLNTFCARRRRTRTVCNNLSEMCTHLATATSNEERGTAKATLVQQRQRRYLYISRIHEHTQEFYISQILAVTHRHTHTYSCSYGYIYTDTDTFINMSPGLMCQLAIFDSLVPTKRPPSVCLSFLSFPCPSPTPA